VKVFNARSTFGPKSIVKAIDRIWKCRAASVVVRTIGMAVL